MRLSKQIRGYKNYIIYNDGSIYSVKSKKYITPHQSYKKHYAYYYIQLHKNGVSECFNLAKLVLKYFKPNELSKKMSLPLHLDLNTKNNKVDNLTAGTLGDRKRIINTIKKAKRGVYKWKNSKYTKWRAVLKIDEKAVTLGYFNTKKEAETLYFDKFKEVYGYAPY